MTAYATLMPTKANAATLTLKPVGEVQAITGSSIEFKLELTPSPMSIIKIIDFSFIRGDATELSDPTAGISIELNSLINGLTTIGTRTYTVLQPEKDGMSDVLATVHYEEIGPSGTARFNGAASGADVVPVEIVPEPITIFGTAIALGCGALFKRKSSKKTVS
jgi:hypothetical protein